MKLFCNNLRFSTGINKKIQGAWKTKCILFLLKRPCNLNFDDFLVRDAQENNEIKAMSGRSKMHLCHVVLIDRAIDFLKSAVPACELFSGL